MIKEFIKECLFFQGPTKNYVLTGVSVWILNISLILYLIGWISNSIILFKPAALLQIIGYILLGILFIKSL